MSGILRLESLTKGNTLKQGDKTPLKYRLFDADGEKLNIAGKSAKVRLAYPDFLTIGYEKDGLTVAQDDTVTFTIDQAIPARVYHVEIIVDGQFVFPSRADEAKFTVDKSSLGAETNIIEIVGKDILIREVKSQVDTELQPLVTSLESAEQAETQRASEESSRASAESQRKIDHSNRSAELAGKADKVVIKNEIENGDFSDGTKGWHVNSIIGQLGIENGMLKYVSNSTQIGPSYNSFWFRAGHKYYFRGDIKAPETVYLRIAYTDSNFAVKSDLSNILHTLSDVVEPTQDSQLTVRYLPTSHDITSEISIGNFQAFNLTEIFGAGNEPTKKEMDKLIEVTGYIDGEYALNNKEMLDYLMNNIRDRSEKADKVVELDYFITFQDFVGGRNLVLGTSDTEFTEVTIKHSTDLVTYNTELKVEQGATYAVSIFVGDLSIPVRMEIGTGNQYGFLTNAQTNPMPLKPNQIHTYVVTFDRTISTHGAMYLRFRSDLADNTVVRFNKLKVTKGSTIYPYTKAPEDFSEITQRDVDEYIATTLPSINDLATKANKKQEDWIRPTMLNGTVSHHTMAVRYLKDTLGFVTIEGTLIDSPNAVIFNLPLGYRPKANMNGFDSRGIGLRIQTNGDVRVWSASTLERIIYIRFSTEG